jgi:hypothetical protein
VAVLDAVGEVVWGEGGGVLATELGSWAAAWFGGEVGVGICGFAFWCRFGVRFGFGLGLGCVLGCGSGDSTGN